MDLNRPHTAFDALTPFNLGRACHPRDLIGLIKDTARYRQVPPALSKELLDQACQVFLVDL